MQKASRIKMSGIKMSGIKMSGIKMSGIKIDGDPWASGDPPSASAKRSWPNKNWWDTSSAKKVTGIKNDLVPG